MGQKARYVLPVVVDPVDHVCFQINVPDDPQHIAAFMGQIYDLAWQQNWQRDSAHTAKDVAAVWQIIFDKLSDDVLNGVIECSMFDIRLDPLDSCTIQKTTDGGVTWVDAFSMYSCAYGAGLQASKDNQGPGGTGPGPGQQGPGGSGTPGACYDWDVEIQGNGIWLCPMPVANSDTVTISLAQGGWFDGDITHPWRCPDGGEYILGACDIIYHVQGSPDPAPTLNHMRLIARVEGQTSGEYVDGFNTAVNIGAGATGNFTLQANDSPLSDNAGSVKCHVQLCKAGWCYEFDFLTTDGGFTAKGAGPQTWVPGTGWTGIDAPFSDVYIHKTFTSSQVLWMEITFNVTTPDNNDTQESYFYHAGTLQAVVVEHTHTITNHVERLNFSGSADEIVMAINAASASSMTGAIVTKCKIVGSGASPFGANNC